jgi:NAD+ synthase
MIKKLLEIPTDPPIICEEIETFIRNTMTKLKREGAVIGLSGGLDSAVAATLIVRSLGKEMVHLLNLPERDSKKIHRKHAHQLATHLGVPLHVKRITSILKSSGTYKILPLRFFPTRSWRARAVEYARTHFVRHGGEKLLQDRLEAKGHSWIARGNAYIMAKHRIRMVQVYQFAELRNLMVVGAANRTEWFTGTFSKWGVDHCADIMPVVHLYRSQLEQIAEYLNIPDYILKKPADPDILPGLADKNELLGGFHLTDPILYEMEQQVGKEELYSKYPKSNVDQLCALWESSQHMRISPFHL